MDQISTAIFKNRWTNCIKRFIRLWWYNFAIQPRLLSVTHHRWFCALCFFYKCVVTHFLIICVLLTTFCWILWQQYTCCVVENYYERERERFYKIVATWIKWIKLEIVFFIFWIFNIYHLLSSTIKYIIIALFLWTLIILSVSNCL